MRSLALLPLLLPLALSADTIVSHTGENGWDAYSDYINAKSYSFDFGTMAGTTDGALTITTSGVADIASKGIFGTSLSSFTGATYRWESSTRVVGLKLELSRTFTIWGHTYSYSFGTLVYDPVVTQTSTDWITTTVDANSLWRLTSGKGSQTLAKWLADSKVGAATITAIELGLGSSDSKTVSSGSIDWLDYSISSGGTVTTQKVDFAAPIPEPATIAALFAIGGLGVALIARHRKQRR